MVLPYRIITYFLFFIPLWLGAQSYNPSGHHFITNYSAKQYKLNPQNFDIEQADNGLMYFANDGGLLEYDGENWRTIAIPTQRTYSVKKSAGGLIYVGARENFGFLRVKGKGETYYVSLSDAHCKGPVPTIRQIVACGEWIYFIPEEELQAGFFYAWNEISKKAIKVNFGGNPVFTGSTGTHMIFQLPGKGIFRAEGTRIVSIGNESLWKNITIQQVFHFNADFIVFTSEGYFNSDPSFNTKTTRKTLATPLRCNQIIQANNRIIACASSGIYINSSAGELQFLLNKKYNLVDNNVTRIFMDRDNNLWAATENGISSIDVNNRLTYFTYADGIDGAVDYIGKYRKNLLVETHSDVFFLHDRISVDDIGCFRAQKSISNRTFGLCSLAAGRDTLLLIADFNGILQYKSDNVYERVYECAPWNVVTCKSHPDLVLVPDALDGLHILVYRQGHFIPVQVPGLEKRSGRQIYEDSRGDFWLSDETNGIFKIHMDRQHGSFSFSTDFYNEAQGLPAGYTFAFEYNHKLLFGTERGFYEWKEGKFEICKWLKLDFARSYTLHRASVDQHNNLWVSAYDVDDIKKYFFGYASESMGKITWVNKPFLKISEEKIDAIFHENENVTWLGGPDGLFRYDFSKSGFFQRSYKLLLRKLRIDADSLVYGGAGKYDENGFVFPFSAHHYVFDFAATYYKSANGVRYRYFLEGGDDHWSKYTHNPYVEFSNLYEGKYVLHVKAMDDYGNESEAFTVSFTISPPWYRTAYAYVGYVVLFVLIIVGAVRISSRGLKNIIAQRTHEIEEQKHIVEEKNKEIIDSISYAQRLQQAILPNVRDIHRTMPDAFVLYKPKDIIAGDFYWMERVDDAALFAVCDCTGHGVPGAMVSIVGANSLNRCVKEFALTEPARILDKLTLLVEETFSKSDSEVKDGMDVSLCRFHPASMELQWSGANNPIWMIRNGELREIKADKQPIGKYDNRKPFTNHIIPIEPGDAVYLFSDGFADQFGGESGKKFKYGKLKELILAHSTLPMIDQQRIYDEMFESWRGDQEQTDDVCLWGIRF